VGGTHDRKWSRDLTHCHWFPDYIYCAAVITKPFRGVLWGLKGRLVSSLWSCVAADG
jgi:hypothetical protein